MQEHGLGESKELESFLAETLHHSELRASEISSSLSEVQSNLQLAKSNLRSS